MPADEEFSWIAMSKAAKCCCAAAWSSFCFLRHALLTWPGLPSKESACLVIFADLKAGTTKSPLSQHNFVLLTQESIMLSPDACQHHNLRQLGLQQRYMCTFSSRFAAPSQVSPTFVVGQLFSSMGIQPWLSAVCNTQAEDFCIVRAFANLDRMHPGKR